MVINNIGVVQSGNNYMLYLPTNICIAQIIMPPDTAYMADAKAMEYITKAVAMRWQVYKGQSPSNHKNG
jgi:hypothetical protein